MRNFKSYIRTLAVAAVVAAGFASCQDDVDDPSAKAPVSTLQPNTTILELKEKFWSADTNYADTIADKDDPSRRFIISGTVVSSDEEGNIFKSIVIQDKTAALAFSVDSYNLYLRYRRGQEVVMDVTGMEIGKYAGLQQIGRKSWYENGKSWQVSFMAPETFYAHTELNGYPSPAAIDTLVINSFTELSQTPEGLRTLQSRLVRFKNVYFNEGGQRKLSVWHTKVNEEQNTTIVDRNGGTLTVRTSGYSTFFNTTLPVGNIDIVGILSYYNSSWQLMMLDGDGIIRVGDLPGEKDKPYTVSQAIEEEKAGIASEGWVKGYIVGTLAPEVEDNVSKNSDLQFEPPFVISTSLVIAESATETDYNRCIVVPVAVESALQKYGNLAANPANLGKAILIKGKLSKYLGTWGLTGNTGKADSFEIEGIEIVEGGTGTLEDPYTPTKALQLAQALDAEGKVENVYVKGTVASVKEVSTQFGNATYAITDGTSTLSIYRGYGLNGDKFTSAEQIKVGAEVEVYGTLVNYMGNTPQMTTGSKLVSYDGGTMPPDQPGGGDEPAVPGDAITISAKSLTLPGSTTVDGYTITVEQGSGSTPPSLHASSGAARIYADNTVTISGPATAKIVFSIASTNKFRYTTFTPNTGTLSPAQASGDTSVTWLGNATSVTFTVGHDATLGSDGASKRGQIHISDIVIYPAK